jgi:hypothetical protein
VSRTQFELDENGHGFAIYCLQTPAYRYHVVVFSRHLEDAQRTDRVIAEAWDLTFCLLEGEVDAELMSALSANVPLQEAGRQHPRLLVISRANKSVRAFATVSAALASGQQPDIDHLKEVGYLYRTTAVYGNGKFGIADFDRLKGYQDFLAAFLCANGGGLYAQRIFSGSGRAYREAGRPGPRRGPALRRATLPGNRQFHWAGHGPFSDQSPPTHQSVGLGSGASAGCGSCATAK